MKTSSTVLLKLIAFVAVLSQAVHAITNGVLDGDEHPHVGMMVAVDAGGNYMWRCSGTLLSNTVFLTAGHCVEGDVARASLWFDSDVESLGLTREELANGEVMGDVFLHPEYNPSAFFTNDLGIVILNEPLSMPRYGILPDAGLLDELAASMPNPKIRFTPVGYGLQEINPVFVEAEKVRMSANPKLIQINVPGFTGDFSVLLSNNHATGGTCFGDSGGPNFLDVKGYSNDIVAGVTSFGINGNCAGTGGVYRVDQEFDIDWVNTFLNPE